MSESDNGKTGKRADVLLMALGRFPSRSAARAAIEAGLVVADGKPVRRASQILTAGMKIETAPAHPYVSRGGVKLAAALDAFAVDPSGLRCLDLGASTGGFTDVLLQRGAAHVTAVDVGTGQFHPSLRGHDRITVLEQQDVRTLEARQLGGVPSLVVADLSFIGLEKALGPVLHLLDEGAQLVALFKPQFQVGPDHIGKGGLVRDGAAVARAEMGFSDWLREQSWSVKDWMDSPIRGGDGNAERLVHAVRRGDLRR
ncbi:MAG: TlyA family RNA methyltransferase [Pseudomonadota bacterium]